MKRARIILFLGVWIGLLPFLGFPKSWKNILFVLTGLVLVYISYIFYHESKRRIGKLAHKENFENFSENKDFNLNNDQKN